MAVIVFLMRDIGSRGAHQFAIASTPPHRITCEKRVFTSNGDLQIKLRIHRHCERSAGCTP